jgi:hypothetical protein
MITRLIELLPADRVRPDLIIYLSGGKAWRASSDFVLWRYSISNKIKRLEAFLMKQPPAAG